MQVTTPHLRYSLTRLHTLRSDEHRARNARRHSEWHFRRAQVAHAGRLHPATALAALLADPSTPVTPRLPRTVQVDTWIDLAIVATAVGMVVLGMNLIML